MTFTYPSHTTKGCVPLSSDVIIFEKEFWAMPHTSTGARIIDMLESFGIKDSLVYSTEDINYEKIINYNIVSKNVDKLANSSKQWLIKALDETNL